MTANGGVATQSADAGAAEAAPVADPWAVRFRNVTKRFGQNCVLDCLDLDVARSEKVAIIGPSGGGKSTLLRALMTLEPIDDGVIEVDGAPLTHMTRNGSLVPASPGYLRRQRGKIGMVFQQFNLFPHMTALANIIEAPRHVLGLPYRQAAERARALLDMVGLANKADAYPGQMSGGQQQRVAIARALAMRPKVMLFDEVTSALDPELVGEVLSIIRKLGEEQKLTMLIVTHQMGFAREFADRVCFLYAGRIAEQGPPGQVFGEPRNERTRAFLKAVLEIDMTKPAAKVIRGRWIICGATQPVISDGAVVVVGDRVAEVGDRSELLAKYPDAAVLGSDDIAVMPGLINAHHHSWAATPIQHARRDQPLEQWILSGKSMRGSDDYLDTLVSAARLLASGVTSVVDAYFGGGTAKHYAAAVGEGIRAYEDAGMRVAFSTGVDTQSFLVWGNGEDQRFIEHLPQELQAATAALLPGPDSITGDEYLAVIEDYKRRYEAHPTIDVWFGPGGPHWMPDELLTKVAERAAAIGTRIQTHCIETIYEKQHGQLFYGKPTVLHLRDIGFLSDRLSIAHGVWATEPEIEVLAEKGVAVSHNPSSNLRLRAGIAPVMAFREAGIPVALGMDGFGINDDEDMFAEMRLAMRLHGSPPLDGAALSSRDVLGLATEGGARLMGKAQSLGQIAPGFLADLLLVDLKRITSPWVAPEVDPVDLIVYRARTADIRTVLVSGEIVYADGRPTRFDADAAMREVSALLASQPFRQERADLVRRVMPYFNAWYLGRKQPEPKPYTYFNSRH